MADNHPEGEPLTTESGSSSTANTPSFEPIFAIFQGGGAKGITHVGALKAIEEERLVPVGVAGTSAGAIVAALVAVGYRADDLLNSQSGDSILGGKSPIQWLGSFNWFWFKLLKSLILVLAALAAISSLATALTLFLALRGYRAKTFADVSLCVFIITLLLLAVLITPPLLRRGMFPSHKLRDLINDKLREKLREHYLTLGWSKEPPELVTFGDIDPVSVPLCRALKVVTSDVRGRKLVLFDASTPGVVVADAVTASAAIPGAFAPPIVRGWTRDERPVFADGGLVSNLPSWVFTVEKRALERQQQGPPIPILAFTLAPPTVRAREKIAKGSSIFGYIGDVLGTGIFSSQEIVEQFVADLDLIRLPTPLLTLEFDCSWEKAKDAHKAGYAAAHEALRLRRRGQLVTNRLLSLLLADIQADVARRRTRAGMPTPGLRLALVDATGPADREASEFRVTASAGMDKDADDQLPLDPRNAAAPRAYRDRKAVYASVSQASAQDLWMTKYERALVRPGLCSIIAIPVFGRPAASQSALPPAQRVLCLDSNDSLRDEFDDPTFMTKLSQLSLATSATLIRERLVKEMHDAKTGTL